MAQQTTRIIVNGRPYAWPDRPVVVICIDGSEPDYIDRAMADGWMPYLAKALQHGTRRLADCVIPAFTNPNNLSIVTGVPPRVHGICGNFFYDRDSDTEVMMNDPKFLRTGTILAAFESAGAKVGVVTAKDKLRLLLGHGLVFDGGRAVCFSAEKANQTARVSHGIDDALGFVGLPLPSVYSADLSEFVFAAGARLLEVEQPELLYLSTTDYIQHKYAPGTPVANAFYGMMDGYLARMHDLGATLALTADHGMQAKTDAHGNPDVIYLQSLMDAWLGAGRARVILPITDPYVVHHGALGGFATIYLTDANDTAGVLARLSTYEGVACALSRVEGCQRFELPEDRLGDVLVVSTRHKVLGSCAEAHDLSGLHEPLRSHGGISEQRVPLLLNRPTPTLAAERPLRNYDIFDVALNHADISADGR